MKSSLVLFFMIASFSVLSIVNIHAQIFVDASATAGANNGNSWADAYTSLETALANQVAGQEIRVAGGTYKPSASRLCTSGCSTDIHYYFLINENIILKGSYNPATNLQDSSNPSILSGDIGVPNDKSDNTVHVLVTLNLSNAAIIEGFTVTGGNARLAGTTQTIDNTNITAFNGGAMYNRLSSPSIINTIFLDNESNFRGGGIFNLLSSPIITNNIFYTNISASGGAIFNLVSSPTITNTSFVDNFANGVIYNSSVAGLSNPLIYNSMFYNLSTIVNEAGNSATGNNNVTDNYQAPGFDKLVMRFIDIEDIDGLDNILGTADDGLIPTVGSYYQPSPLRDTGDNSKNSTPTDITGQARIQNGTINVGAYENACTDSVIIYVDKNATGNETGTDWANAYKDLTYALTLEHCSLVPEIRVASGTYSPTYGIHCYNCSSGTYFLISKDLKLKGGYNPATNTQDYTNPTILKGDSHSLSILLIMGVGPSTIVDGFSIQDQPLSSHPLNFYSVFNEYINPRRGGGINCIGSELTISNTTFSNNEANFGGGIYITEGVGIEGAPTFVNSSFIGNIANTNGGGIHIGNSEEFSILNTSFINNSAANNGGGIYAFASYPAITNLIFENNSALNGGGIYCNQCFFSNQEYFLNNSVFTSNTATNAGGGLYSISSEIPIINTTFSNNSASLGGGIYSDGTDNISLYNSVFYSNGVDIELTSPSSITGSNNFSENFVQSGFTALTSDPFKAISDPDGIDNIYFTEDDGLFPAPTSLLIDGGDSNQNTLSTDIIGKARNIGLSIDAGPYELQCVQNLVLGIQDNPLSGIYSAGQRIIINAPSQILANESVELSAPVVEYSSIFTLGNNATLTISKDGCN